MVLVPSQSIGRGGQYFLTILSKTGEDGDIKTTGHNPHSLPYPPIPNHAHPTHPLLSTLIHAHPRTLLTNHNQPRPTMPANTLPSPTPTPCPPTHTHPHPRTPKHTPPTHSHPHPTTPTHAHPHTPIPTHPHPPTPTHTHPPTHPHPSPLTPIHANHYRTTPNHAYRNSPHPHSPPRPQPTPFQLLSHPARPTACVISGFLCLPKSIGRGGRYFLTILSKTGEDGGHKDHRTGPIITVSFIMDHNGYHGVKAKLMECGAYSVVIK